MFELCIIMTMHKTTPFVTVAEVIIIRYAITKVSWACSATVSSLSSCPRTQLNVYRLQTMVQCILHNVSVDGRGCGSGAAAVSEGAAPLRATRRRPARSCAVGGAVTRWEGRGGGGDAVWTAETAPVSLGTRQTAAPARQHVERAISQESPPAPAV